MAHSHSKIPGRRSSGIKGRLGRGIRLVGTDELARARRLTLELWLFGGVCMSAGCGEPELAPVPEPAQGASNGFLAGSNAFTQPIAGLEEQLRKDFISGRTLFVQPWVQAPASTESRDGLGPLFNARSCENCHPDNGRSSPLAPDGSLSSGLLFRVGHMEHVDPVYGSQLQNHALLHVPPEAKVRKESFPVPGTALLAPNYLVEDLGYGPLAPNMGLSPRIGGAVAGLGLLEAVSPDDWQSLEDPQDANNDGISGRVHWVTDASGTRMGRFGWKAQMPDLRAQVAGAYRDDMGLTSSLHPSQPCTPTQTACLAQPAGGDPEISDAALMRTVIYVQLLAVPRSPKRMDRARWHANLARFKEVGCADCHVPRAVTASQGVLEPLAGREIWPFTDMLLHDMGPLLADSYPLPGAEPQEWRTPALWGIGHYPEVNGHQFLLHDGRANGVAEAIAWHDGEGRAAKEAFFALDPQAQQDLIQFIEQL